MELSEFLEKEKELFEKESLLYQEIAQIRIELSMLHSKAIKDGFVWEPTEKKWYKELD